MTFRSFRNGLLGGALAFATAVAAVPAFADVTVDFGFVPLGGTITYSPDGAVGNATSVSGLNTIPLYIVNTVFADDTTGVALGIQPVVNWFDAIDFAEGSQTLAKAVTESFTGTAGTYEASFDTLFAPAPADSTSLTWVLAGTLTNPDDSTQAIYLSAAFTNISNSNDSSTNVSFTETSSPPPVINAPEPASMALLGVGLLGMGAIRRRRG